MLQFDRVRISYGPGVIAVDGASLSVGADQCVALVGGNGAGKSTLLKAASGILRASGGRVAEGEITWRGNRIEPLSASRIVRSGVAHVPEGRRIFGELTVEQNLEAAGLILRDRDERHRLMEQSFERFPVLGERRRQHAGYLSGGEQQMLAICRGLMSKPSLLILDEPTLGLAPLIVEQIATAVREIHAAGAAVLLVEQNAAVALSVADHAYVLERGRVVLEGPAAELRASDEVRRLYLGAGAERTRTAARTVTRSISRWAA